MAPSGPHSGPLFQIDGPPRRPSLFQIDGPR